MKRLVSILSGVIMLLALLPGSTAKGQDSVFLPAIFRHISERVALVALYESTDGDDWTTNYNWLSDSVHHCEWYGITCTSEEGVVRQIELSLNNLQGAIPREIGNLANLQGSMAGRQQPDFTACRNRLSHQTEGPTAGRQQSEFTPSHNRQSHEHGSIAAGKQRSDFTATRNRQPCQSAGAAP